MAGESEFVEQVTFRASGAESVKSAASGIKQELEQSRKAQEALSDAMSDAGHRRQIGDLDTLTRKNREWAAQVVATQRATERLTASRNGDYLRGYREEQRIKDQLRRADQLERSQRLAADREQFRKGDPLSRARAEFRLSRDAVRFEREKDHSNLTARLGMARTGEFTPDARDQVRHGLRSEAVDRAERLVMLQERLNVSAGDELGIARQKTQETAARQQLADKIGRAERQARLEQLRGGGGLREAQERLRASREEMSIARLTAAHDREAKYGRAGGRLVGLANSHMAGMAFNGAVAGAAAVGGMATAGFSGTVQGERLSLELTMLSRSVAGAFVPAVEAATDGIKHLRRTSDSLSSGQQRALAATTIGLVGLKAASMASTRLLGVGLIEAGVAAGTFGGRLFGGAAARQAALASLGPGAGAGAIGALGVGPAAAIAGGVAANVYVGSDAANSGDYGAMRQQGFSKAGAAAFSMLMAQQRATAGSVNFVTGLMGMGDVMSSPARLPGSPDAVTPSASGFGELGSSADRLTQSLDARNDSFQKAMERTAIATEAIAAAVGGAAVPPKQ